MVIIDFYDAAGVWLDSCDSSQYDAGRLARLLAARFGPVTSRVRQGVAVDVPALSFGEWLLSL